MHIEAARNPVAIAKDLRAAGAQAGLSIKPETPLEALVETLKHYDILLIMSVEPGLSGRRFIPEVLDKVRTARRLVDTGHLRLLIEIAGGVNSESIEVAAEAGADCFVAGSAVYGASDPARAVRALREKAKAASAVADDTSPQTQADQAGTRPIHRPGADTPNA